MADSQTIRGPRIFICRPARGGGVSKRSWREEPTREPMPTHSAAGSYQAGISSERGPIVHCMAPVHTLSIQSALVLQRVNLRRLRFWDSVCGMQVDRCRGIVQIRSEAHHPHACFSHGRVRRRLEPNGSGRPSNAHQGGEYETLGRIRSFAAPFASRGPLPGSCCQTPAHEPEVLLSIALTD